MLVFTKMRNQWKKYLIVCALAFAAIGGITAALYLGGSGLPQSATCDELGEYSLAVQTGEQEINFLKQFGLQAKADSLVSDSVVIPSEFNGVYREYNDLQREIGLNLQDFKGVTAQRHIYRLENYESGKGDFYVTLLIYEDRVIGGHIGTKIYGDEYRPLV